jgi:hypothetical protein
MSLRIHLVVGVIRRQQFSRAVELECSCGLGSHMQSSLNGHSTALNKPPDKQESSLSLLTSFIEFLYG